MASLAEGLALAAQAGLSQAELLEIISLGAMANPMFKLKVRRQASVSATAWHVQEAEGTACNTGLTNTCTPNLSQGARLLFFLLSI